MLAKPTREERAAIRQAEIAKAKAERERRIAKQAAAAAEQQAQGK
jgi:uncharacterized small protein (DUF1192 family)